MHSHLNLRQFAHDLFDNAFSIWLKHVASKPTTYINSCAQCTSMNECSKSFNPYNIPCRGVIFFLQLFTFNKSFVCVCRTIPTLSHTLLSLKFNFRFRFKRVINVMSDFGLPLKDSIQHNQDHLEDCTSRNIIQSNPSLRKLPDNVLLVRCTLLASI